MVDFLEGMNYRVCEVYFFFVFGRFETSPLLGGWVTLHDVYTISESSMYIYPQRNMISSRLVKGAWNIGDLFCANEPIVDAQPYMYKCSWVYICRPPLLGWSPSPTEKNGCLDPSANGNVGLSCPAPAIAAAHPRPSPWLRSQLKKNEKVAHLLIYHTLILWDKTQQKLKSLNDLSGRNIVLRGLHLFYNQQFQAPRIRGACIFT